MSLYAMQKFLYAMNREADVQQRYLEGGATRDTLLAGYDLDEEERARSAMATSASSTCWDATASC
jgi:hypothetical protein